MAPPINRCGAPLLPPLAAIVVALLGCGLAVAAGTVTGRGRLLVDNGLALTPQMG